MKVVLSTAPRAAGEIEMGGLPFLGIGYIASFLEQEGHEVRLVDAHSEYLDVEQTTARILSFAPDVAGFSATTHNRLSAIAAMRLLKKRQPSLMIMAGGPHFALTAENALAMVPELDCVVRGEGELTAGELLKAWPHQERLKEAAGLTYRNEQGWPVSNPDRPFLRDWSCLPFPAWHLYDLSRYQKRIYGTDFRTIGVISGRGCPNLCTFCANAAFSRSRLRLRTTDNFIDELELLKGKYGFHAFNFWDDTLTISKQHVMDVCDKILKKKLDIKWYARARVNTVDEEMIAAMKRAGCVRISFGIESGSPRILKVIKKNIALDQVERAVRLSSQAGFIVSLNFIVNLPEETMADLAMTAALIRKLKRLPRVQASYGFALIYPGTAMETFAKEHGILPTDFSWNTPYHVANARVSGEDASVPHMEWRGKELERVKAFMVKHATRPSDVLSKAYHKVKRVQSWTDLKVLAKTGLRYFRV